MTAKDRGVIYVALETDAEIESAFLSAVGVKRFCPDLGVALITSRSDHPLLRAGCFDRVIPLAGSATGGDPSDRIACLAQTPFDRTLYFANDRWIETPDLHRVFSFVDDADVAMAEAAADVSTLRAYTSFPVFDTGVIVYRCTAGISAWLRAWHQRFRTFLACAAQMPVPVMDPVAHVSDPELRHDLLSMDQTALMDLVNPQFNKCDLRVRVLPYAWNHTGSQMPAYLLSPIHVRHRPDLQANARAELLALAYAWQSERPADSERIYAYVGERQKNAAVLEAETWRTSLLRNGDLHLQYGQADLAAAVFTAMPPSDPAFAYALAGRARIEVSRNRHETAVTLASRAAAACPDSPYIRAVQGLAFMTSRQIGAAVEPLTIGAHGGNAAAAFHLGVVCRQQNDFPGAAAAFRRACMLDSGHTAAAVNLIPVLMRMRKYDEALEAAHRFLADHPGHIEVLSYKHIALLELGETVAARALTDVDKYIVDERPAPPAGYASTQDFTRALARVLRAEPSLQRDPAAHATRNGWHTGDLSNSKVPEIQALMGLIRAAVERRRNTVGVADHPFVAARPRHYRLHTWAVVMEEGGHQIPHIHASGWLSGIYYVQVPEEMVADDPGRNGWLVFGGGDARWQQASTMPTAHAVRPEAGLLVTFPSFYWHETRPLRSTNRRISFAFDVIPAYPWKPE